MDTTAKRYILIFFGILLVILMGAYLLKLINAPQAKPLGDNQQEPLLHGVG